MNQPAVDCRSRSRGTPGSMPPVSAIFDPIFSVELANTDALRDEVHALRYQVYCMERPFEDASCFPDGRERDDYDERSVHALIRHRPTGVCAATVRLVLTDEDDREAPFPMEGPCEGMLGNGAMATLAETPRQRTAEISRFAVSREFRRRCSEETTIGGSSDHGNVDTADADAHRAMPYIAVGLFAAVMRLSIKHSITHWLAVMEPTLLRLLKRYGIEFGHVGATVNYHGRRKPVVTEAAALVERIGYQRPDIWTYLTEGGRIVPPSPLRCNAVHHRAISLRRHTTTLLNKPATHNIPAGRRLPGSTGLSEVASQRRVAS